MLNSHEIQSFVMVQIIDPRRGFRAYHEQSYKTLKENNGKRSDFMIMKSTSLNEEYVSYKLRACTLEHTPDRCVWLQRSIRRIMVHVAGAVRLLHTKGRTTTSYPRSCVFLQIHTQTVRRINSTKL